MLIQDFEKMFEETQEHSRNVLIEKAREYANPTDRLHNFKEAANVDCATPEMALWGMFMKHFISIKDIKDSASFQRVSKEMLNEKFGDAINYLILLKALLYERYGYCEVPKKK